MRCWVRPGWWMMRDAEMQERQYYRRTAVPPYRHRSVGLCGEWVGPGASSPPGWPLPAQNPATPS